MTSPRTAPGTHPPTVVQAAGRGRETRSALDGSLVRGLAWTGAVRWGSQVLSWLSTVVVARLLTPADYGLVGMAAVYLGLVLLVNDFGLGSAIIQRRDLSENQLARIGGLSLALGTGFFALSGVLAIPLARFFGEPAIRLIVPVSSLGFILGSLQVLPRSLLARELSFRRLALVDGIEAIASTVVTLLFALADAGYWALVLGPLGGRLVGTSLLALWRPHRLAQPWPASTITTATTFGRHLVLGRIAWYLYSNADFAIVGRFLGRTALGAYTLGWTIASIPVDRITALVGSVIPSILASVQHDKAELRRYIRTLTEGLSLITFPMAVGMALVSGDLVLVLFGEQWRPAIRPLQILALAAATRSVTPILPQIAVAMGDTRRNMQRTVVASLVVPVLFIVGSRWGTTGVAIGWLVGHPLVVMPLYLQLVLQLTEMRLSSYLRALLPATVLTALMAIGILASQALMGSATPGGVRLGIQVLAGMAIYGILIAAFYRERAKTILAVLRGSKK